MAKLKKHPARPKAPKSNAPATVAAYANRLQAWAKKCTDVDAYNNAVKNAKDYKASLKGTDLSGLEKVIKLGNRTIVHYTKKPKRAS